MFQNKLINLTSTKKYLLFGIYRVAKSFSKKFQDFWSIFNIF